MRSLHKPYENPLPVLCRLPAECFLSLALSLQEGDPSVSCRSQAQGGNFPPRGGEKTQLKTEASRGSVSLQQESMASSRLGPTSFIFSQLTSRECAAPWFNMQRHQHLIITWTMTPGHLVLVKNHSWLWQLQAGTCHPPPQEWTQAPLQPLTFNTLWAEFRVEGRNEALGAPGKLTGPVFRQLDIFRSWLYEANSSISSYLE